MSLKANAPGKQVLNNNFIIFESGKPLITKINEKLFVIWF